MHAIATTTQLMTANELWRTPEDGIGRTAFAGDLAQPMHYLTGTVFLHERHVAGGQPRLLSIRLAAVQNEGDINQNGDGSHNAPVRMNREFKIN